MSETDDDAPEGVTPDEERERILAEVLAHTALRDRAYGRTPEARRVRALWKLPVVAALLAAAAYLTVRPPAWATAAAPAPPAAAEVERGLRSSLLLQAREIEVFRSLRGRLPRSLAEAERRLPGVRYIRSGSRAYQLTARAPDGSVLVYDSVRPDPRFQALARSWRRASPPSAP